MMTTEDIERRARTNGLRAVNIAILPEGVQVSTRGNSDGWQVFAGRTLQSALDKAFYHTYPADEIEDLLA